MSASKMRLRISQKDFETREPKHSFSLENLFQNCNIGLYGFLKSCQLIKNNQCAIKVPYGDELIVSW